MPVYLCESGIGSPEPWRCGIQVYASPFPVHENLSVNSEDNDNNRSNNTVVASSSVASLSPTGVGMNVHFNNAANTTPADRQQQQQQQQDAPNDNDDNNINNGNSHNEWTMASPSVTRMNPQRTNNNDDGYDGQQPQQQGRPTSDNRRSGNNNTTAGIPIRRVRHAEVVLVDDVCVAYGRYWLRLRWPGGKGGFAGYIAMGLTSETTTNNSQIQQQQTHFISGEGGGEIRQGQELILSPQEVSFPSPTGAGTARDISVTQQQQRSPDHDNFEGRIGSGEIDDLDDEGRDGDEEPHEEQEGGSTKSSEPFECMADAPLTCLRTGVSFPTSTAMKLMSVYDDGLQPPVASAPVPTEPVFCRICREGLHDDDDDEQPSGAVPEEGVEDNAQQVVPSHEQNTGNETDESEAPDSIQSLLDTNRNTKGPVKPHPSYHPNQHAAENPLLAPCECSGSMAFVHYLCVEQWRCRSRHPEAHHGLQCETCGGRYSLPPPSARHANAPPVEVEDWLDAMPPHVMNALRLPHISWQIGAAVVRRRWLRPIAPVIMSPLVALYCRARRLLKKRGVARRRWACSLCRRRARWKCVRCLRSYYCSRQCQNVSWHIVHKHVCYKPARFWWSVVVYGIATIILFPGIIRDPLMYDLGLCTIPASFVIMAILGGGLATLLKKSPMAIDLRGRTFELVILLLTLGLVLISWGVVGGFFGNTQKCYGALGQYRVSSNSSSANKFIIHLVHKAILKPSETYYLFWDRLALKSGPWLKKVFCTNATLSQNDEKADSNSSASCFEHLPNANADFIFSLGNMDRNVDVSNDEARCAFDLLLITWLYILAGFVLISQNLWKRRERQRRAFARAGGVRHGGHHDERGLGGLGLAERMNLMRNLLIEQRQQQQQPRPHQD